MKKRSAFRYFKFILLILLLIVGVIGCFKIFKGNGADFITGIFKFLGSSLLIFFIRIKSTQSVDIQSFTHTFIVKKLKIFIRMP